MACLIGGRIGLKSGVSCNRDYDHDTLVHVGVVIGMGESGHITDSEGERLNREECCVFRRGVDFVC